MCFGGNSAPAPRAPEIKYVGPSESDIRRNEESLQAFQQQMTQQNQAFQTQLQQQIDRANQEYADLERQYASDLTMQQSAADTAIGNANTAATTASNEANTAAAAAAQAEADAAAAARQAELDAAAAQQQAAAQGAFEQSGAYQVSTTESDPVNTQETAAKTDKKKPKITLKIGQNTVAATAGTGLNIGT